MQTYCDYAMIFKIFLKDILENRYANNNNKIQKIYYCR